jgi:hypothetical protein
MPSKMRYGFLIGLVAISVPFGDGRNPSPSGEVPFAIGSIDPEPPSPLMGEGWDEGDKGFIVHPHPCPPPSKGEGVFGST